MGLLVSLLDSIRENLERHRNKPFLRACMAACAMVACADGDVSFAERVRLDQILETLDRIKVFDPHEGVDVFNAFADAILENAETGHAKAWQALEDGAPDPNARKLVVRMCFAVSQANTRADDSMAVSDRLEIMNLCSRLGVDPADCDIEVNGI